MDDSRNDKKKKKKIDDGNTWSGRVILDVSSFDAFATRKKVDETTIRPGAQQTNGPNDRLPDRASREEDVPEECTVRPTATRRTRWLHDIHK